MLAAFPTTNQKERHKAIEQRRRDRTKELVQQLQSLMVRSHNSNYIARLHLHLHHPSP
jgi:hypothetical protein